MMMQMLGSFAEFERAMVRERTRAGAEIARIFRVRATISRIATAAKAIPAKAELVSSP
jgi:DNA invertase Pin-like site-specific DNA recombinase